MRHFRPNIAARALYRDAFFRIPGDGKDLYMTFDDGPTPGVTDRLAEIISDRSVPATFFTTGSKVISNPVLIERLRSAGFGIANHGMKHLNGFRTDRKRYFENFREGMRLTGSNLFRPPYGKITPSQYRLIRKFARIVFWDIMPYDYDWGMSAEKVLVVLETKIRPGSIVVMHDYERSVSPLILGKFIDYCVDEGYTFKPLIIT